MAEAKLTLKGREKLCKAHSGAASLPPVKHIAFGDGGINAGVVLSVTGEEVELRNELIRLETKHVFPVSTTCSFNALLAKSELANKKINEYGLFDEEGDLVLYKTFLDKGKDDDMEFSFTVDEIW